VLLEKIIGSKLVKKFPTFYGTRRFNTAFTCAHHLPCPEPGRFNPCPHIPLPEDPSQYYPPIYTRDFLVTSFPQVFPPKP